MKTNLKNLQGKGLYSITKSSFRQILEVILLLTKHDSTLRILPFPKNPDVTLPKPYFPSPDLASKFTNPLLRTFSTEKCIACEQHSFPLASSSTAAFHVAEKFWVYKLENTISAIYVSLHYLELKSVFMTAFFLVFQNNSEDMLMSDCGSPGSDLSMSLSASNSDMLSDVLMESSIMDDSSSALGDSNDLNFDHSYR